MNRLEQIKEGKDLLLSIYLTCGFPTPEYTVPLCEMLAAQGVRMIELGIPFSDPIADGPTIQEASTKALKSGIGARETLDIAKQVRERVSIPLVLMGHLNPIMQIGAEKYFTTAKDYGVDGFIIPDLPPEVYEKEFHDLFLALDLSMNFLITSETDDARLKYLDSLSRGFLYAVSSHGVTGGSLDVDERRKEYLRHLGTLSLRNPIMVGFGIDSAKTFESLRGLAQGGIIGSAFLRALSNTQKPLESAQHFIASFV